MVATELTRLARLAIVIVHGVWMPSRNKVEVEGANEAIQTTSHTASTKSRNRV